MKNFMNAFVFSIIIQMALAPLNLSFTGKAYAEDSSCADEGKVFDRSTGRCVLSKDVVDTKVKANKCGGLTGEAYSECFKKNAQEGVSELEKDGLKSTDKVSKGKVARYGVPIVASLVAGLYLLQNKSKLKQCSSTSMWLILGAAASGMVTEFSAQRSYKKKLKSLLKNYENRAQPSQTEGDEEETLDKNSEVQTLALKLMIEQEKARKDAASKRESGHSLAMGLYASAVLVSIYEQVQFGGADSCMDIKSQATTMTSPATSTNQLEARINLENFWLDEKFRKEFGEYSYLKEVTVSEFLEMISRKIWSNIALSDAYAEDTSKGTDGEKEQPPVQDEPSKEDQTKDVGGEIAKAVVVDKVSGSGVTTGDTPKVGAEAIDESGGTGTIQKMLDSGFGRTISGWVDDITSSPWKRGAFAGVMGGYSKYLVDNAKDNKKIADQRIEAITELLKKFEDTDGARFSPCTDEERSNPGKPECFCYTNEGTADPRRIERDICKAYTRANFSGPGSYGGLGSYGYQPVKACFKDGDKVDEGCKVCKKDPKRCPAIAKANLGTLNFGGNLGMTELVKQSNALNTGRLSTTDLDPATLHQMAAKMGAAKKKLINSDKKYKAASKKMDKMADSFRKAAPGLFKKSFGGGAPQLAALGGSAPSIPAALQDNKEIEEALGAIDAKQVFGGGGSVGAPSSSDDEMDFGFGDMSEGGVVIDSAEEIMEKDFAIKGDIHKNPDNNIFKILSLRYQRSGLRRLFDTEGVSEADAASDTEINQK